MWASEIKQLQQLWRLTREEKLNNLDSFISECAEVWEREGLDWAPGLLDLLRDFRQEAVAAWPDQAEMDTLGAYIFSYSVVHRLHDLGWVLWIVLSFSRDEERVVEH